MPEETILEETIPEALNISKEAYTKIANHELKVISKILTTTETCTEVAEKLIKHHKKLSEIEEKVFFIILLKAIEDPLKFFALTISIAGENHDN